MVYDVASPKSIGTNNPFVAEIPERVDMIYVVSTNDASQRCGIFSAAHYRYSAV